MKKLIVFGIIFILIIHTASADFLDDFNRDADYYKVEQAQKFTSEEETFYMSGSVLMYYKEGIATVMGVDPIRTLAVACCAADSMDRKDSGDEITGRLFRAYLNALKAEDRKAWSVYQGNYIKILVEITDDYLMIGLSQ